MIQFVGLLGILGAACAAPSLAARGNGVIFRANQEVLRKKLSPSVFCVVPNTITGSQAEGAYCIVLSFPTIGQAISLLDQ